MTYFLFQLYFCLYYYSCPPFFLLCPPWPSLLTSWVFFFKSLLNPVQYHVNEIGFGKWICSLENLKSKINAEKRESGLRAIMCTAKWYQWSSSVGNSLWIIFITMVLATACPFIVFQLAPRLGCDCDQIQRKDPSLQSH